MTKPASKSKNNQKASSRTKAYFKTQSQDGFKRSTYAVSKKKDAMNMKIKEKIKEKRAVKTQQKNLKKAEEESSRQQAQKELSEVKRQLKKKRLERTKIISKKTNRGQPLMKDRIQYLLGKIQEMKRS